MIGELPLVRFRQIVAAIQMRMIRMERQENSRLTWMTRTLSQFIVGGYFSSGGNAAEIATRIAFDEVDRALAGTLGEKAAGGGQTPAENSNGSFERFMSMAAGLDQRGKMI